MSEARASRPHSLKKPCDKCPFSRSVQPGALGGSDPLVYVAQARGPF